MKKILQRILRLFWRKEPVYPYSFKIKAVHQALNDNRSLRQIEAELNLAPGTLQKWIRQYRSPEIQARKARQMELMQRELSSMYKGGHLL